ncbi:outer membrane lipoprotein-sorting protein [uncultured Desulfosarcina sp.]|uniref:outer membrane lipoprotein-sorting protein n=1 Tax=uncultured Desulfosarcina sp. TaxID=218289 RepID=UPI0029C6471E|nr:outer membrane lipoprotein-sorting protein [uncultured Desulfosarcina sp.]
MKRNMVLAVLFVLVGCLSAHAAEIGPYDPAATEPDGRRIFDIADNFNRPRKDLVVVARMTLKSGDTVSDTRNVIIKELTDGDLSRFLFRFTDSLKRGLTFLTIETHGPDNDQYLFVPAIGRPRQIASQDRQNNFEDTDLTNEDLGGIKLDDYTYKRGSDATLAGQACFKVTAVAKAEGARFPKRIAWFDQKTFIPLQIKVYNRDNKLQRVIVAGDVRPVGVIHLPFKTVAKDLLEDHTTILEVVQAEVDSGIDGLDFDKEKMGAAWKEEF